MTPYPRDTPNHGGTMSIQDDIFELDRYLKHAHKMKPAQAREARRCFDRVLKRLHDAERAEEKYIEIMQAFSTIRYVFAMKLP